jgi:hypothetical protein
MGKVFTIKEIENKHFPLISNFKIIRDFFVKNVQKNKGILGALICGSVATETFNIRSDFDSVVIYDEKFEIEVKTVLRKITDYAANIYVPIEILAVNSYWSRTGFHSLGVSYLEHCLKFGKIIKGDPNKLINPKHNDKKQDAIDYLIRKMHSFNKMFIGFSLLNEPDKHRLLQKMLDFPIHAGRRMLQAKGFSFPLGDSKREVVRRYRELGIYQAHKIMDLVVQTDFNYSEILKNQLLKTDKISYEEILINILNLESLIMEFADLNLKNITK